PERFSAGNQRHVAYNANMWGLHVDRHLGKIGECSLPASAHGAPADDDGLARRMECADSFILSPDHVECRKIALRQRCVEGRVGGNELGNFRFVDCERMCARQEDDYEQTETKNTG